MSRRKRQLKEREKQKVREAKKKRQQHFPEKCEEKKRRKRQEQEANNKENMDKEEMCPVDPFKISSPSLCKWCMIEDCKCRKDFKF